MGANIGSVNRTENPAMELQTPSVRGGKNDATIRTNSTTKKIRSKSPTVSANRKNISLIIKAEPVT
jgi:hypothetical protein